MSTISAVLPAPPDNFSTTLSSDISNNALTIPLGTNSGLGTEGVGVIYAKNTDGEPIASSVEFIHWTNTGTNSVTLSDTDDRGITGSYNGAQAHSNGDTFEVWVSSSYYPRAALLTFLTTAGVIDTTKVVDLTSTQTLTNKTLTSPVINTPTGDVVTPTTTAKRALYIPANGMFGATTNGAASGQVESSTNKVNFKVLDFDKDTDEYACFSIPAPLYWDLGTITAQFYWTNSSGGSAAETVKWYAQAVALSNDDATDTAYGTAVGVEDALIAASDVHVTSATSAITVAGTPAAGDWLAFRIYRDVSEDTLAGDARLIGVRIEFGVNKFTDAA